MNVISDYVTRLYAVILREPVRTVGVIRSGIMLVLAFWPGLLTPDQTTALVGFAAILLGVDQAVRSQVIPVAKA